MVLPRFPNDPNTLYLYASDLLNCAYEALCATPNGKPARHGVVAGSLVPVDECCAGYLWTAMGRIYVSDRFPEELFGQDKFFAAQVVAEFEVGIARCAPSPTTSGRGQVSMPTAEALDENAQRVLADAWALQRGVSCCLRSWSDQGHPVALREQTPFGPEGGCVGSTLTVQVGLGVCPCDSPVLSP